MRWLLLGLLVGCAADADTVQVARATCTRTSATSFSATADFDATLGKTETMIDEVIFNASDTFTIGTTEQWSCGAWTNYGATGCSRDPSQPASAHLSMTHDETVDGTLATPLQLEIVGKVLGDSSGSTMTITCP